MLLLQKNECKSFLIFILGIVGIHGSGTSPPAQNPLLLSKLVLELHGATSFSLETSPAKRSFLSDSANPAFQRTLEDIFGIGVAFATKISR
jgi:hypothetical protein